MKATRTKRMAALVGLLMALTLTATGCQVAPNPNGQKAAPATPPVTKVSDYDPAKTMLDAEWEAVFGKDPALSTPIAKAGIKILSVMFDEHPEYTRKGFVPTDKEWNAVKTSLTPLVNAKALQFMESKWTAKKDLPVMMSYRTAPDKDGVHGYTYTTAAGEKCTDSGVPYEYKNEAVNLTARPGEDGNQLPVFSSNVSVVVHCEEGILLQGQMLAWFPMVEVDGKWIMLDLYEVNPTGPFEKMLVVG